MPETQIRQSPSRRAIISVLFGLLGMLLSSYLAVAAVQDMASGYLERVQLTDSRGKSVDLYGVDGIRNDPQWFARTYTNSDALQSYPVRIESYKRVFRRIAFQEEFAQVDLLNLCDENSTAEEHRDMLEFVSALDVGADVMTGLTKAASEMKIVNLGYVPGKDQLSRSMNSIKTLARKAKAGKFDNVFNLASAIVDGLTLVDNGTVLLAGAELMQAYRIDAGMIRLRHVLGALPATTEDAMREGLTAVIHELESLPTDFWSRFRESVRLHESEWRQGLITSAKLVNDGLLLTIKSYGSSPAGGYVAAIFFVYDTWALIQDWQDNSRDASTFATVHIAVSHISGKGRTELEDETSEYAQYAYFKGMTDALSVSYLKFFEVFRRSQREVRLTFSTASDVMKFTIFQRRIGEFFASFQRSLQSEAQFEEATKARPAVLIILDNSSSMLEKTADGRTKFEVAKTCLLEIVRSCSNSQTWGIIDFRGCTPVMVQPFTRSRDEVLKAVETISAYGTTPIAGGLQLSLDEIEKDPVVKRCVVVLLTDGMETCGGDPLRSAASFGTRSPLFLRTVGSISLMPMVYAQERLKPAYLYVIGFGVDTATDIYLRAIASAAAGKYFAAKDLAQLLDALKEALKIVLTTDWEAPVLVLTLMMLLGGVVWVVIMIKRRETRPAP